MNCVGLFIVQNCYRKNEIATEVIDVDLPQMKNAGDLKCFRLH